MAVLSTRRVAWRAAPGATVVSRPATDGGFEPAQALALALADPALAARGRLALRVDDDWVRLFGVHWQPPVAGEAMRRSWLDAELARRFDVDSADWRIESPQSWPGRWSLAAAMPVALHEGLTDVRDSTHAARLRPAATDAAAGGRPSVAGVGRWLRDRRRGPGVVSLLPWSLAEADAVLRRAGRGTLLLVGSDAPRRTVLLCIGGRPVDAVRLPGTGAPWLQAIEIFRARGHGLPETLPVRLIVSPRDEAVDLLLSGRPLVIDARVVATTATAVAKPAAESSASMAGAAS